MAPHNKVSPKGPVLQTVKRCPKGAILVPFIFLVQIFLVKVVTVMCVLFQLNCRVAIMKPDGISTIYRGSTSYWMGVKLVSCLIPFKLFKPFAPFSYFVLKPLFPKRFGNISTFDIIYCGIPVEFTIPHGYTY